MIKYLEEEEYLDSESFRYLEPIVRKEITISNRELYTFKVQVKEEYRKYLKIKDMTDLKQLWLIDIDPNKMDKVNNTLIMQNGSVKVKQLGHYIESADNSGRYRNRANNTKIKEIMSGIGIITSDDLKNADSLFRFPRLSLSRDKVKDTTREV